MARQNGLLKIDGTVGGMTFYRSKDGNMVREKGGVSKERIANDPAFARTRENGAEFGTAGTSGKLMRDSLRPLMLNSADGRVTSRVTALMAQMQKLDVVSVRGKRNVGGAIAGANAATAKAMFKNFNFNKAVVLGAVLYKPYAVNTTTGVITIANITPINDIAFPAGATHVSFSGAFGNLNFATSVVDVRYTNVVNMQINSGLTTVTLTPSAAATGTGVKLFLLKVEFFQLINGVQYSLKNGAFNALAIIEAA